MRLPVPLELRMGIPIGRAKKNMFRSNPFYVMKKYVPFQSVPCQGENVFQSVIVTRYVDRWFRSVARWPVGVHEHHRTVDRQSASHLTDCHTGELRSLGSNSERRPVGVIFLGK